MAIKIPDFKIRENLVVKGSTTIQQDLITSGDSKFSNSTFKGDFLCTGSATISGGLTVRGATTFVESSHVRLEDPLIALGHGNSATDVNDIGFFSTYYDTSLSGIRYTGLFRDADDGVYKLFSGLSANPAAGGIDTTDPGITLGTLSAAIDGSLINNSSIGISKLVPFTSTTDSISLSTVSDTLRADIRLSDTSLQVLSTGPSGLSIAPSGVSATHISTGAIESHHISDDVIQTNHIGASAVTNQEIATPTFSVNGTVGQLGSNIEIATGGDPIELFNATVASMSASIGTTATTFDTCSLLSGCDAFSYIVRVKHPDAAEYHRQLTNLTVVYDGTDLLLTETGTCSLSSDIANFTAAISGNNIYVQAYHTLSSGSADLKAIRTNFD